MFVTGVTFLSLEGRFVSNNSNIRFGNIGCNNDMALLCHTDHYVPDNRHSGGDWFAPNRDRIGGENVTVPGLTRNRDKRIVRLIRNDPGAVPFSGIYTCEINSTEQVKSILKVTLYTNKTGIHTQFCS